MCYLAVLQTLLEVGYVGCSTHLVHHVTEQFPFTYIVLILSSLIIWLDYPRRIIWHIVVCNNFLGWKVSADKKMLSG